MTQPETTKRRSDLTGPPDGLVDPGIVAAQADLGGGAATPSVRIPAGAGDGLPGAPRSTRIGDRVFAWGTRTFVMGILNVTPDSFSGDGLLGAADPVAAAAVQARAMVEEGADLLDVGGESTRPGHATVSIDDEIARVVPVIRAVRAEAPGVPISIDTTKPAVAEAALDAGAVLLNDIWGVAADDALLRVAAERRAPIVLMHNRAEARYRNLVAEVIADLQRAIDRALDAGIAWDDLLVDPGFGFGKSPEQNLAIVRELDRLRVLGRPILLGTSRKSTLGKILDLGPDERLEATLATTALGVAAGADLVRVHDVRANVRVARTADAIIRAVPGPARAEGSGGR
ncbi:MAG TPA: dihydropteroate synthase [Candidatus Limnocylindrales bacterium]|nr:dihydropteroate synthase [Candidatus Limnocylindrales bacterium]